MVKELIVHLGDCKTGTTSIQSVLSSVGYTSCAKTVCYPTRFSHNPLARPLMPNNRGKKTSRTLAPAAEALLASDADVGVISAEHLEYVEPEALKAALEEYMPELIGNMRLIAYIRPHAERLVSTFAERSKNGMYMSDLATMFQRTERNGLLYYAKRLAKWRAVFGDQMHVRPFVRSELKDGDVVADFLDFMLSGSDFTITQKMQTNAAMTVEDLAMFRHLHRTFREEDTKELEDQRKAFGRFLSDHLATIPARGGTKLQLHKGLAKKMLKTYGDDARQLDAEYFGKPLFLPALEAAQGKAVDKPQSLDAKDHFSDGEIRRYEGFAQMVKHMMTSDPRHFSWVVRPDNKRNSLESYRSNNGYVDVD